MLNLLRIEYRKFISYTPSWFLIVIYFLLLFLSYKIVTGVVFNINAQFPSADSPNVDSSVLLVGFNAICQNITWGVTFLNIIPAILLTLSISNDFSFKTLKQSLINGMSEKEYILGKLLTITIFSLMSGFVVLALCLFVSDDSVSTGWGGYQYIVYFCLHLFSYLVIMMFVSLLFKKAALSIAFMFAYSWVIEPLIAWKIGKPIANFLPFHTLNHLNPSSFLVMFSKEMTATVSMNSILIAMAYSLVITVLSYFYIKKIDL